MGWDRIDWCNVAMACYPCMLSLHVVIVDCHCMLPLFVVVACCHCMLSLHVAIACCHCWLPLHVPIACCQCLLPLHVAFASCQTLVWNFSGTSLELLHNRKWMISLSIRYVRSHFPNTFFSMTLIPWHLYSKIRINLVSPSQSKVKTGAAFVIAVRECSLTVTQQKCWSNTHLGPKTR